MFRRCSTRSSTVKVVSLNDRFATSWAVRLKLLNISVIYRIKLILIVVWLVVLHISYISFFSFYCHNLCAKLFYF